MRQDLIAKQNLSTRNTRLVVLVLFFMLLYVPSRFFLLFMFTPGPADSDLYARYAWFKEQARERGEDFYEVYRQAGEKQGSLGFLTIRELTEIQYPTLAGRFMTIPTRFILKGGTTDATTLEDFTVHYRQWYRFICLPFDLVVVMLALWLVYAGFPRDRIIDTIIRAGTIAGAGVLMPFLLFDRLEIVSAAILLVSFVLVRHKRWVASLFVFALALHFKPVAIFCTPLWIFAAMPWDRLHACAIHQRIRQAGVYVAGRTATLAGWVAGMGAVFALIDGKEVYYYVLYHKARGIHIESTWGTFTLLLSHLFNGAVKPVYEFGAFNINYSGAHGMSTIASALTAILAAGAGIVLFWRALAESPSSSSVTNPERLPGLAVAFLGITFCVFKMFSPHFLFLLVPLLPLIRLRGIFLFGMCTVFCGSLCMSTFIYPYFYMSDIANGPTVFGLFLLVTRTIMLCIFTTAAIVLEIAPPVFSGVWKKTTRA